MITLKHGKFFKDGEPMPLEFGNREQIDLLNRSKELLEFGEMLDLELVGDGKKITGFEHAIRCLCGEILCFKTPDRIDTSFRSEKKSCICGLVYQSFDDDDFGYMAKIIKTPTL